MTFTDADSWSKNKNPRIKDLRVPTQHLLMQIHEVKL